ncbi:non-hydrolyzing UDP-N-acetylglucosamine 2-epimerase [Sunxiuqinia indica]|uniref:non-hydrolyzing UDP-N-acetylglucosamine 2-epimerase n=1 Tax=Sunxiuqinia indica TaxID=2692584 RepID=UPI00135BB5B2|nr:UDP-N-acetylglucosamine 2-epimerase (non-hydrolyzing) [Sunxiuqinia indica]
MNKKILTIVGARPQFVKAAAVSRALNYFDLNEIIVHTGQHFDYGMSEIFFSEMEIPHPKYNLGINSLSHGAMTGRMLEEIESIILKEKPDFVMVYGDTNSTLAGALAASKLHIPVAHVEAGLRSFNRKMPEEINRILTDRISSVLFCPTQTAISNLQKEGYGHFNCQVELVGDVMYDAAMYYSEKSAEKSKIIHDLNLTTPFILATLHRQENTDDLNNLTSIIEAFNEIGQSTEVLLPLHPRTRKIIEQAALKTNFRVIDPVGYFDMIELLKHCSLVMTDSGGLQKESYFFEKNCITLRDETEWTELVEKGYNVLTGARKNTIVVQAEKMVQKKNNFSTRLYGDGSAGMKIAEFLAGKD